MAVPAAGPGGNGPMGISAAVVAPGTTMPMPGPHGKPGEIPGKPETPGQPSAKPEDAKTKDSVKPVHRPSAPAVSPNPDEFKVLPDSTLRIRLNFNGQPWQPVLEWLAKISNMSLDWQELPGDYLNLSTRRKYTVPEVRDLINRHLLARGYTLLCHGEVMTVADVKKIDPSLVPRVEPADLAKRDPHEFVKVSFPLVSLLAEVAVEEMHPMISPNGRLTALNETNRLEAMDAVTNLCDIAAVLKQQQAEDKQPRSFHEFPLKHARASEVYHLLTVLLDVESSKSSAMGGPQGNMNPAQAQAMQMAVMQAGGQPGMQPPGGNPPKPKGGAINLVVNEHNNSILAQARPDKMAMIAQVIEAVDVPSRHSDSLLANLNRMQVYRLSGVDPEPVVKTLMDIGNLDPATRLEVDKKTSAIVAYASLADHVTIRAVVDKLSGSERKFQVIRLRRLAADYVAGTIDFMMGSGSKKEKPRYNPFFGSFDSRRDGAENSKEFHVEADVEHNRLLVWANPVELADVQDLLAKLGEIPASGSGLAALRVIDGGDEKETQELIERIRHAWPSIAPNALLAPPPPAVLPPEEKSKEPAPPLPILPKDSSTTSAVPGPLPNPAAGQAQAAKFHLADIRGELADSPADERAVDQRAVEQWVRENAHPTPPVKISVGPDGKLVLSSDDAQALDRLEDLAAQLAPPHKDYRVFRLKYASAVGVSLNLEDFFKEKKEPSRRLPWYFDDYDSQNDSQDDRRLSKRRKLTFISDSESNTILVEGASAEQLKTIEDLIQLYDKPPPSDSQSIRKTQIVRLKYSKAKAVADTVKDVYRDLLSANDKALANGGNQARDVGRNFLFNFNDNDKTEQKIPKFKGLLSIGVDEISNSLMVSAPAYLFDHVTKMIKDLDEAAAPDYTVQMVHVHGISAARMKEMLNEVLMQKAAEKSAEKQPGQERPGGKTAKTAKSGTRGESQRRQSSGGEGE